MNELQNDTATRVEGIGFWLLSAIEWMQIGGSASFVQDSLATANGLVDDIINWNTRKADGWNWEAK